MIQMSLQIVAWGLVVVLVWSHGFVEPPKPVGQFSAVAELDQSTYLVAQNRVAQHEGDRPHFGLIRFVDGVLGYRDVTVEDWEADLNGQVAAMCSIKGYAGELLLLVVNDQINLVHVQMRNWLKTPKSAILGRAKVVNESIEAVSITSNVAVPLAETLSSAAPETSRSVTYAMSCDEADAASMALKIYGINGTNAINGHFRFAEHTFEADGISLGDVQWTSAYRDARGEWVSTLDPQSGNSQIWLQSAEMEGTWQPMFRLDGFAVVGLAAGPAGFELSVVTAEPGVGSVWRPLKGAAH